MDEIRVSCTGAELVDFHTLTEFQGNLKRRTEDHLRKLKQSIRKDGFSFPFFIWAEDNAKHIIDGHGRLQALRELEEEGWTIPLLPAAYIIAENEHDAKLKLLKCLSRYGDITEAAFAYFTDGIDIESLSDIEVQFDKVEILKIDADKYLEGVKSMLETSVVDTEQASTSILIVCPVCMEENTYSVEEVKKAINAILP